MTTLASARTIYLLSRAHYAVRSRIDQVLGAADLTGVQYTILSLLKGRAQLSSAQIARHYYVKPQTMNEVIFSLERRAFIRRTPDPRNKRTLRIELTDAGHEALRTCDHMVDALEDEIFAGLSTQDLDGLRATLKHILDTLGSRGSED